MKYKGPYQILGYSFQGGHVEIESERETLAEAKRYARHLLSEAERQLTESAHRLGYSQVIDADGGCVADYFNSVNTQEILEAETL